MGPRREDNGDAVWQSCNTTDLPPHKIVSRKMKKEREKQKAGLVTLELLLYVIVVVP